MSKLTGLILWIGKKTNNLTSNNQNGILGIDTVVKGAKSFFKNLK
jgi:hypothetical protein